MLVAFYFDCRENLSLAALNIRFKGVGLLSLQEMGVNHTLNFKDKSYLDIVPALMDKITLKSVDPLEGLRGEFSMFILWFMWCIPCSYMWPPCTSLFLRIFHSFVN